MHGSGLFGSSTGGANGQGSGANGLGNGANGQGAGANGLGSGNLGSGLANNNGLNGSGGLNDSDFNAPGGDGGLNSASSVQGQLNRIRQRQLAQLNQQQLQQEAAAIQTAMSTQATQLFAAWMPPPQQQYAEGKPPKEAQAGEGNGAGNSSLETGGFAGGGAGGAHPELAGDSIRRIEPKMMIKAGTILFASLITSINSDQPGPVLARVVSGHYKGAEFIGRFVPPGGQDKVTITFNTMEIQSVHHSISVNVVAIDPNTARTALSSWTDHHYLIRYGTLFASAFVEGYAQALSQSGATTTITPNGLSINTFPPLNGKQKIAYALGQVGQRYSSVLSSEFTRNPTVYVKSGTSVGLLFLQDVANQSAG